MIALALILATVTGNPPPAVYTCNSSTKVFTIPFPYLAASDLLVQTKNAAGGLVTLALTTDYTIKPSIAPSTGTLTTTAACVSGSTLIVSRNMALTQPQSFRTGSYQGPAHEQAYDREVMLIQQNAATHAADKATQATKDAAQDLATAGVIASVGALNTGSHAVADTTSILAFGSSTARTLTSRFSDTKNVLDYGATCNGSTDDTAAITATITALPAQGGTLLLPNGCSLLVSDQNTISKPYTRVVAYGAKLTQTGALKRGLTLNAAGIVVEGGWYFNTHGNTEWADAPAGSTNAIGLYVDTGCDGCKVINVRVEQWGYAAIRVYQSRYVTIQGCELIGIGATKPLTAGTNNNIGIEAYLSGVGYPGLRIIGNTVHDFAQGIYTGFDWQDVIITNNVVRDIQGQHAMYLGGAVNMVVANNTIKTTGQNGIKVQISTDTTLNPENIAITGNTIDAATNAGIIVLPAQAGLTPRFKNVSIVGNTVRNSLEGVDVDQADNFNIALNTISGSAGSGIQTRSNNGSGRVSGNLVTVSQQTALYLRARTTADLGIVENNYIIDPAQSGTGTSDVRSGIYLSTGEWIARENVITATNLTPISFSININGTATATLQRNRTLATKNNVTSGTILVDGYVGVGAPGGGTLTPNAQTTNTYVVTASAAAANWTHAAPANPTSDATLTFTIRNTSAGALGTLTWNAVYKMAAWTMPGAGTSRSITFRYDGTNWIEVSRTPADVPN